MSKVGTRSKARSLSIVTSAYVLAVAVGAAWLVWGPATGRLWLDTLIADILATLVVFSFSRAYRNSSFYDAYWSVIPPLLLFFWWARNGDADAWRCWLLAVLVVVWAVRLTGNWVYAFPGLHHEDWRYAMFRERAGRGEFVADLVAVHLIPTRAGVPRDGARLRRGDDPRERDGVAERSSRSSSAMAAVALEFVADVQMHRFVRDRKPGEVMDRGLWAWSRHPNYFGEFGFWFALALFGVAASPTAWWLFLGAAARPISAGRASG